MCSKKNSEDLNIAIFTRILSKTMGGMERQILSIANDLIEGGHNVIIISLDQVIPDLFFDANSKIQFVPISEGNASLNADIVERLKRQKKVFKLLKDKQIDVAITFMTGAYWYSAIPIRLRGIGLILAERNSPTIYDHIRVGRMRHLIFASMVLASKITVQFESYRDRYPFYLRRRIVEIPNKIPQYVTNARPSDTRFHFVYAGRFSHQKQILELAHAFISFHKQNPETILEIYGDGELKKDLEQIIIKNKLEIIASSITATLESVLDIYNLIQTSDLSNNKQFKQCRDRINKSLANLIKWSDSILLNTYQKVNLEVKIIESSRKLIKNLNK
jgi:glycosyltransferase involved in cell wall biosynthesis